MDAAHAELVLVPDTSVLLKNPDLASWSPGRRALIVISSTVIGELDNQKEQFEIHFVVAGMGCQQPVAGWRNPGNELRSPIKL